MNEADIQRINELARKSKTVEGLTEAELAEQAALRKAYIASVKRNLKTQLDILISRKLMEVSHM